MNILCCGDGNQIGVLFQLLRVANYTYSNYAGVTAHMKQEEATKTCKTCFQFNYRPVAGEIDFYFLVPNLQKGYPKTCQQPSDLFAVLEGRSPSEANQISLRPTNHIHMFLRTLYPSLHGSELDLSTFLFEEKKKTKTTTMFCLLKAFKNPV